MSLASLKPRGKKIHRCPICKRYRKQKDIVRYHIQYYPSITVRACKYCNQTEYFLRKKRDSALNSSLGRTALVLDFQKKHSSIKYSY